MELLQHLALGLAVAVQPQTSSTPSSARCSGRSSAFCPASVRLPPSRCCCRSPSDSRPAAIIMLAGIYYGAQYGGSTTAILVNCRAILVGRDHVRRLPDGPAGQGRPRACDRGARLVPRRNGRDPRRGRCGTRTGGVRAGVRSRRLFLAHDVRLGGRRDPGAGLGDQGARHDRFRHVAWHDRHRHEQRYRALHVQHSRSSTTDSTSRSWPWACSDSAKPSRTSNGRSTFARRRPYPGPLAEAQGPQSHLPPALRGTALGSALGILPGGGPILASFSAYSLEKKISANPNASAMERSRALPRRRPPTTRRRRPPSFRC